MKCRTVVIGDIHGCLAHLDALLCRVLPNPDDHLILLGDYIDRGPDSAGVLKRILQLSSRHRLALLMGNHEQMMLEARQSHDRLATWITEGGDATLRSYAGARSTIRDIPADHWQLLETKLANYLESQTHIFVHAAVLPELEITEQPDYVLKWERCDNIKPHKSGKVIVCGHTPQPNGRPMNRGYAICLDTGACAGGLLTCLEVESGRIWQADGRAHVSTAHISDF
ncbi:MAG TPA: metallophosphoesterase family protein [Tepidisphaeraceae bacterium]|nr:metallophosphoesterase family protein [Tepidisphaeraceae bacterium]